VIYELKKLFLSRIGKHGWNQEKYALNRTSQTLLEGNEKAPSFVRYSILAALRRLSNGDVDVFELIESGMVYRSLVLSTVDRELSADGFWVVWTRDMLLDSPRKTVLSGPSRGPAWLEFVVCGLALNIGVVEGLLMPISPFSGREYPLGAL